MPQDSGKQKTIWTIGHSAHPLEDFLAMLRSFGIGALADVRNFPGSRKFPHFGKDALEISMPEAGIRYVHFKDLGGRRKPSPDSVNTAWRHPAFRGYADYMETDAFRNAVSSLAALAAETPTAFMCSEAVWWRCHRSLVADYLKHRGWTVMHIMGIGIGKEHPYTSAAKIIDGRLDYSEEGKLF